MREPNNLIAMFAVIVIAVLLMAITSCGYPDAATPDAKFHIGQTVRLNDITIPGLVQPLVITKKYQDYYQNWYYDARDSRDTTYFHFIQYQLKK